MVKLLPRRKRTAKLCPADGDNERQTKMDLRKAMFYVLAVMLGGCGTVSTIQPLHSEKDVTFDEKLLGVWAKDANDVKDTWKIERLEDEEKTYKLTFTDDKDNKGVFVMQLLKLKDQLYVDLVPAAFPSGEEDLDDAPLAYNGMHFLRLHTFARIDAIEPVLQVSVIGEKDMMEFLGEHPDALAHVVAEDDKLVITASTAKLQEFVLKHKANEQLFKGDIELQRVK